MDLEEQAAGHLGQVLVMGLGGQIIALNFMSQDAYANNLIHFPYPAILEA
jgi:hypothetical protein